MYASPEVLLQNLLTLAEKPHSIFKCVSTLDYASAVFLGILAIKKKSKTSRA